MNPALTCLLSPQEKVDEFFQDLFSDGIMESKVESIMALAALLQGPFEVGCGISCSV